MGAAAKRAETKQASGEAPELHVFLASGVATASSGAGCARGKRYSLLIFSRQPAGQEANKRLAREGAGTAGWKEVKLERSKVLPATAAPGEATLRAAFADALADGCAVVAYKKPLAPA